MTSIVTEDGTPFPDIAANHSLHDRPGWSRNAAISNVFGSGTVQYVVNMNDAAL